MNNGAHGGEAHRADAAMRHLGRSHHMRNCTPQFSPHVHGPTLTRYPDPRQLRRLAAARPMYSLSQFFSRLEAKRDAKAKARTSLFAETWQKGYMSCNSKLCNQLCKMSLEVG